MTSRIFLLASALAALFLFPANYNITGTGAAWTVSVGSYADLIGGAGTNLKDAVESGTAQYVINIGGGPGSKTWQVDVRRDNTSWNGALTLSVKRTSDGTGPGTIAGGTNYIPIPVDPSYSVFFTGQETRDGINLQYQISGLTVTLGVHAFSTTVTYTITTI